MRLEKKCPICGKIFETHNRNRKACSEECSKELRRQYSKAWRANHPDYMRIYFAENREKYTRPARRARKEAREASQIKPQRGLIG